MQLWAGSSPASSRLRPGAGGEGLLGRELPLLAAKWSQVGKSPDFKAQPWAFPGPARDSEGQTWDDSSSLCPPSPTSPVGGLLDPFLFLEKEVVLTEGCGLHKWCRFSVGQ